MSVNPKRSVNIGQTPWMRLIFWCFIAIIAFFLLTEHTAHVFGILPYLLILACPLMHIFMHGKYHGHKGDHSSHADSTTDPVPHSEGGK